MVLKAEVGKLRSGGTLLRINPAEDNARVVAYRYNKSQRSEKKMGETPSRVV